MCGSWHLKDEFSYLQHDFSLVPFLPKAIDATEIVAKAREAVLPQYEEEPTGIGDPNSDTQQNVKQKGYSQLALANEAITDKRVTLSEKGCWIVRREDDETPYAVRLFPKETCLCPAVKMCYHIMACKLMIGQEIHDDSKPNMALLSQKIRQKNKEKPSGRKPPRKQDFRKTASKRGKFSVCHNNLTVYMSDNLPQIMARVKMMKLMKLIHQRSKNMITSNPRSTNILHQVS